MKTNRYQLIALVPVVSLFAACQTATSGPPNRFEQADANHDHFLSMDEANSYLVTEVFSGRDANKDGHLTREEWMTGGDPKQGKQFKVRDLNKDGQVSIDEALAYGRQQGAARKFVAAADKNKDGKLSPEEVQAYYASNEGPPR
jgi:Ca2+-binding EF-hand superfamily protein